MAADYKRRWETRRGGRSVADESRTSYYGLPVIHRPHWKWLIIVYFFVGGIAGASSVIASIARLVGGGEGRSIARAGRYLSLAALIPSPILLVLDLGRPERFHYMLRILKLRSPMSIGSWALLIFSGLCGLTAFVQAAEDGLFRRTTKIQGLLLALPARLIAVLTALFGLIMAGYTGVLLGLTAVPIWAKNHLLLGPLFLASAFSNAAAAISLAITAARGDAHVALRRLERLERIALLAELGVILAARANAGEVIGQPIRTGRLGRVLRWGVLGAGIAAPLALQASATLRKKTSRRATALASAFTLVGGFCLRYVMVMAGRASADDPYATHELARRL